MREWHSQQDPVVSDNGRGTQGSTLTDIRQQRSVRQHHAAWTARRAGGVAEQGEVLAAANGGKPLTRRILNHRIGEGGADSSSAIGNPGYAKCETHTAVVQNPVDLPGHGVHPQRHSDRPDPEYREQHHTGLETVGHHDRDPVPPSDPALGEDVRIPVDGGVDPLPGE